MATDESAQIQTDSLAPASVEKDGLSVTQQPVAAKIMADRYAATNPAKRSINRGMRFSKMIGAGPVSDQQATNPAGSGSDFSDGGDQ